MENTNVKDFFVKHQADTAGKAAEEILKLFAEYDNLFMVSNDENDSKKYEETYQKFLAEILVIFKKNNVGITNYSYVFKGIKAIIDSLEQTMNNHMTNLKVELLSRVVGSKNPYNNKYDIDHSTHQDLISALEKIREDQGNNPEDFFTIRK